MNSAFYYTASNNRRKLITFIVFISWEAKKNCTLMKEIELKVKGIRLLPSSFGFKMILKIGPIKNERFIPCSMAYHE